MRTEGNNGKVDINEVYIKDKIKEEARKRTNYIKNHSDEIAEYVASQNPDSSLLGDKEKVKEILESPVFLKHIRMEMVNSEEIRKIISDTMDMNSRKKTIHELLNKYPEIKTLLSLPHPWGDIEIRKIKNYEKLPKNEIFDKLVSLIKEYHDSILTTHPYYYIYSDIIDRFTIIFSSIEKSLEKSNWTKIDDSNISTIPLYNICAYSITAVKEYLKRIGRPDLFDLLKEISYLYSLYFGIKVSPHEVSIVSLNIPLLVFIGFVAVDNVDNNLKLIVNIPLIENLIKYDFSFIRKLLDHDIDEYTIKYSLNTNHIFTFKVLKREDEIVRVYTDLNYLSFLVDMVLLHPIRKEPKEYSRIVYEDIVKDIIQVPEYIPYAFSLIPYLYIDFNLSPSDEYTPEEIEEIRHNLKEMSKLIDRVNYKNIDTKFDKVRTVNSYLKVRLNDDQLIVDLENVSLETRRLIYYMFKTVYPNSNFVIRDKLYTVEDVYDVKQDIKEILEKSFISLLIFKNKEVKPYLRYFKVFADFLFNSPSQHIFYKIYDNNNEIQSPYTFILDLTNDPEFYGTIVDTATDQDFYEYLCEYYEKSYKNALKSIENSSLEDYLLYVYNQFVDVFKEHLLGLRNYDLIKKYEEFLVKKESFDNDKPLITTEEILQKSLSDLFLYRSYFRDLDDLMEIKSGNLIVLGARPSIGKTSFALNYIISLLTLHPNIKIGFISLETQKEYLGLRILQILLGLDKRTLFDKYMKKDPEFQELLKIINDYYLSRLIIISDVYELSEIENRIEKLVNEDKVNLIFLDYLQRMSVFVDKKNVSNTYIGITLSIKSFSTLSKKLNVPIFILSQLNREIEKRRKNDVLLTDLKGSGDIEQEADIVILMNRNRVSADINDVEFNLIKNRDGKIGTVNMLFKGNYLRFSPLDNKNILEPDFYLNVLKEKYSEYVNSQKEENNNDNNYIQKVVYHCPVCNHYEKEIKDGDIIVDTICDDCTNKGYRSYICTNCSATVYNNTGDTICDNCKKFKDTISAEINSLDEIKLHNPKELENGYYTGLTIQCKVCGSDTMYFYKKYDLCPTCYKHLDKIYLTYGILNIIDPNNQLISDTLSKIREHVNTHPDMNLGNSPKAIDFLKNIDDIYNQIKNFYQNKSFKDLYQLYINKIYPISIIGTVFQIYNHFKKTIDYLNKNHIKINFDHISFFGPMFILPVKVISNIENILYDMKNINDIFYNKEKSTDDKVYMNYLNDDSIKEIEKIISDIKERLQYISKFTKFIQINREHVTDYYNSLKEQIINEGNEFYNRYMNLNDKILKLTSNVKQRYILNHVLFAIYYQYVKDKEFREMINKLTDEELLNTLNLLIQIRTPYVMKNPEEITFYNLSDTITLEVLDVDKIPQYVKDIYEKIKHFLNHIGYNINLFEKVKKEENHNNIEKEETIKVYDTKTTKEVTMTREELKDKEIMEGNNIKFIRGAIKSFIYEELKIEKYKPKFPVSVWFNQFYKTVPKLVELWKNAAKTRKWDEFNELLKEIRNYDISNFLSDILQSYTNSYHSEINYEDIDEPIEEIYLSHYIDYLRSIKEIINIIKDNKYINKGVLQKIEFENENMQHIVESFRNQLLNDSFNGNQLLNDSSKKDNSSVNLKSSNYDISQLDDFEKESNNILNEIPLSEDDRLKINTITGYLREIIQCTYDYSYVITGLLKNYYDRILIQFNIDKENKYHSIFSVGSWGNAIKYINQIYGIKQKIIGSGRKKNIEEKALSFYNEVHQLSKNTYLNDSIVQDREELLNIVKENKELYLKTYDMVLDKIKDNEKYQSWYNVLSVMTKFLKDSYDILYDMGKILHSTYIDILKINSVLSKEYDPKDINKNLVNEIISSTSRVYQNDKLFKIHMNNFQFLLSKYIKIFTESLKLFEDVFFILENKDKKENPTNPVLLKLIKELNLQRYDPDHLNIVKDFIDAHIDYDTDQSITFSLSALNIFRVFDSIIHSNEPQVIQSIIDTFFNEKDSRLYVPKWLEIYKYLFEYYKNDIIQYYKPKEIDAFINTIYDLFNAYEKSIEFIKNNKISKENIEEFKDNEYFISIFTNSKKLKPLVIYH